MGLNIASTLQNAVSQATGELGESGGAIADGLAKIVAQKQESLTQLSNALLQGEISETEFAEEIKRESLVIEAELVSIEIAGKAAIQKAVNGFVNTLVGTITKAV
ncbi:MULTISPECIES: hypothetical protein [Pseudoalteromonas]|uniref:Uncharacterized protein n=1 Tax=Pseudoalteromonas obscura TaxID=3048491 RepID=A0ABT7ESZ4_9GAMM|nr:MULTISPECIES: hypothetical protein [Pseudoalteromonas]MBQ4839333.1 hypothetical protein [Pseudoalteromonas luteoviolacea]MDK2598174.1 hypothetical protein [Pseudoalteromonas sp. P94(2023)]